MTLLQVLVLAIVQGVAELLPVSSSAHVIAAEKLMGLDPTAPQMTLLLVLLHTGTMFAVIAHFHRRWRDTYFASGPAFRANARYLVVGTLATGVVGLVLLQALAHLAADPSQPFEVEQLFGNARLIAGALAAAGLLIVVSSRLRARDGELTARRAVLIGAVQGLCLPFRGFSRSGATISTGLALGVARHRAEEFSFALAVVLTPPVVVREAHRLVRAHAFDAMSAAAWWSLVTPCLIGMLLSFAAGLLALRWLSAWLERGRWHLFGLYCLAAAVAILAIG